MTHNIDRDMALLGILAQHLGKANPITAEEVAKHMTEMGHPLQPRSVGNAVRSLMMVYNIPICGINKSGYYWATTDDEIQETIADLESRRTALNERIAHLKKFVKGGEPL